MGKRKRGRGQPLRYRRFATAAEAIRFAVEELPSLRALGAWMQVGDERFNGDDIQRLYESDDFPLQRFGKNLVIVGNAQHRAIRERVVELVRAGAGFLRAVIFGRAGARPDYSIA